MLFSKRVRRRPDARFTALIVAALILPALILTE
jgi:hypothetical protein